MSLLSRLDRWMWQRSETESHSIDKMDLWGRGEDIGDPVHAEVLVSQESALRLSVVWRCIQLISGTLAALPWEAIRKRDSRREVVDRQAGWLIQPNPETNAYEFKERVLESLLMDGNAFILITSRDDLGFPSEIWTLHPREIEVKSRDSRTVFVWNGKIELSRFGPANPSGDVLWLRLATGGGLRGMSPIEAARQAVGLGLVTEKTGARFFGKGMVTNVGIELPADQPASSREHIELIRESVQQAIGGPGRSFRPLVVSGGAKFFKLTITPEEAQFLETRKFQVEDIAARFYGVPAHLVGLEEKNTSWGTGIEAQTRGFLTFTLVPHIIRLEEAFSQLLPRGQFVNVDTKAFLRADKKTETEVLQTQLQNGVINFNHWRGIIDEPPRPGGDAYMVPLNFQIIPPSGVVPVPTPSPNGNTPQEVPSEA